MNLPKLFAVLLFGFVSLPDFAQSTTIPISRKEALKEAVGVQKIRIKGLHYDRSEDPSETRFSGRGTLRITRGARKVKLDLIIGGENVRFTGRQKGATYRKNIKTLYFRTFLQSPSRFGKYGGFEGGNTINIRFTRGKDHKLYSVLNFRGEFDPEEFQNDVMNFTLRQK